MCLDSLIQQLTKEGFKVTPQRKLLLEILQKSEGHLSAEDIFEEIRASQPNVSFGTVYRNLGILCGLGVVTQLDFKDGRSRFEISSGHHHHLVCLDCGNAIDVPMCPFSKTISDTAIANNFLSNTTTLKSTAIVGSAGKKRRNKEEARENIRRYKNEKGSLYLTVTLCRSLFRLQQPVPTGCRKRFMPAPTLYTT